MANSLAWIQLGKYTRTIKLCTISRPIWFRISETLCRHYNSIFKCFWEHKNAISSTKWEVLFTMYTQARIFVRGEISSILQRPLCRRCWVHLLFFPFHFVTDASCTMNLSFAAKGKLKTHMPNNTGFNGGEKSPCFSVISSWDLEEMLSSDTLAWLIQSSDK